MAKKKTRKEMPTEHIDVQWGFEECGNSTNRSGEEMSPSREEFPSVHSKVTPGLNGDIDWNSPGDGWGEFL